MKQMHKAAAFGLAAVMAVSLAACSSAPQSESTAETTPVETAEPTPAPTPTPEPTPLPEAEKTAASVSDLAWVKSHDKADFNLEDLFLANSTTLLAPAGSGKAIKVTVEQYGVSIPEGGMNAQIESEPNYVSTFYSWYDEEGSLNWLRDSMPYASNAYNTVNPDSDYGWSMVWNDGGATMCKVYTETSYQMAACDTFYPLYTYQGISIPISAYSRAEEQEFGMNEEYAPYDDQLAQATYYVFLSDSEGGLYEVYLDDNMAVQAIICSDNFGVREVAIPSIVDISEVPAMPDFADQTIECTVVENGKQYTVPMMTGVNNKIDTSSADATPSDVTIEADTAVTMEEGSSTSIPNNTAFTMDGPVTFTINYTA